jgi:hypothetical protein
VGLSVNLANVNSTLSMANLALTPCPGQNASTQCGISLVMPSQPSGWQSIDLDNVNFGLPAPSATSPYTAFQNAINLTQTWRARIHNCRFQTNNVVGQTAINMVGGCVDTRVTGCSFNGYTQGILYNNYSEGLHFVDNDFVGGTAIQTSQDANRYNVALLEIFVDTCRIQCSLPGLFLFEVKDLYLSNTTFLAPLLDPTAAAICMLEGCGVALIKNCSFTGAWSPGNLQNIVGVALYPSQATATNSSLVDNCKFFQTCTAIEFGPGAQSNSAINLEVYQYGLTGLVDGALSYGTTEQRVYIDNSGNSTNTAMWKRSAGSTWFTTQRQNSEK